MNTCRFPGLVTWDAIPDEKRPHNLWHAVHRSRNYPHHTSILHIGPEARVPRTLIMTNHAYNSMRILLSANINYPFLPDTHLPSE